MGWDLIVFLVILSVFALAVIYALIEHVGCGESACRPRDGAGRHHELHQDSAPILGAVRSSPAPYTLGMFRHSFFLDQPIQRRSDEAQMSAGADSGRCRWVRAIRIAAENPWVASI